MAHIDVASSSNSSARSPRSVKSAIIRFTVFGATGTKFSGQELFLETEVTTRKRIMRLVGFGRLLLVFVMLCAIGKTTRLFDEVGRGFLHGVASTSTGYPVFE